MFFKDQWYLGLGLDKYTVRIIGTFGESYSGIIAALLIDSRPG